MNSNFINLAFSPFGRTNEIIRYSSVHQEMPESLAEHITDVSMMSYLVARYITEEIGDEINIGLLLEKCLLHDVDEVITGDIPRNTKYATETSKGVLEQVAIEAIDQMIQSNITLAGCSTIWRCAKEGKEGFILKVVDMLVVVKKAIIEIELRGNLTFLKVVKELETHVSKLLQSFDSKCPFDNPETSQYLYSLVYYDSC